MAFHDVRLPDHVERGFPFGPESSTDVWEGASGYDKRNGNWSEDLHRGDVSYALLTAWEDGDFSTIENIHAFHRARSGRLHSFRLRAWGDRDIGDQSDPQATRQTIGTSDGVTTAFQVKKTYTDEGGFTRDRTVYLLVQGTLFVYLDGALQTEGVDYTANYTTGFITFTTAPGASTTDEVDVAVTVQFDVQVRFDEDYRPMIMTESTIGSMPSLPVVEVRGAPAA